MTPDSNDITDLLLREDNPYSNGTIVTYQEGDILLERQAITIEKSNRDRYYTSMDGENLWDIAFRAYGNSKLYWVIAEVNGIDFMFDLPSGTSLLVPDLDSIKLNQ